MSEANENQEHLAQPQTREPRQQSEMSVLRELIADLGDRVEALEKNGPAKISVEDLHKALSEHPDMVDFRAFIEKWRPS
jgi:hypothetical protein